MGEPAHASLVPPKMKMIVWIALLVTGVTNSGTRVRVVHAQPIAILLDELMPPGLTYVGYIGVDCLGRVKIPHNVGVRLHVSLESGIGVT